MVLPMTQFGLQTWSDDIQTLEMCPLIVLILTIHFLLPFAQPGSQQFANQTAEVGIPKFPSQTPSILRVAFVSNQREFRAAQTIKDHLLELTKPKIIVVGSIGLFPESRKQKQFTQSTISKFGCHLTSTTGFGITLEPDGVRTCSNTQSPSPFIEKTDRHCCRIHRTVP